MTTKGKILNERSVKVTHKDNRVIVSWDGQVQYSAFQDGWTTEAGAIREAYTMLIDTVGCWVDVSVNDSTPFGGGSYTVRLRAKPQRYDQCGGTCTVDCGHCKGRGKP